MVINSNLLTDNLKNGVSLLAERGYVQTGEQGISVKAVLGNQIIVEKTESEIIITYDTESHFYMALARSFGMGLGTQVIEAKVDRLGYMLDCSRNAVAKPAMVKDLICFLTLAGYNYLELYTEDTYALPDEPYFGYRRGRYSAEELKEIISYAKAFGMEVIPCIQALAHLPNLAVWVTYLNYMDINDILLVGDERTYTLIRKCLRFCKEVFETTRINIGTDEAFALGRGKYLDQNGYKSKHEIYLEHLKRVFEICKEEGLEPEFWADAFYNTDCKTEDIQALFDGTQMPIYWEYDTTEKEPHVEKLLQLKEYAGQVKYAGTTYKWLGYAPDNRMSNRVNKAALTAVMECDVKDVLITGWGDNGDECSVYAVIPSMWYATELLYPCDVDHETIVKELTGYTKEEWLVCDKLNYIIPTHNKITNPAKYLTHNDYLIGLMDYHIPDNAGETYEKMLPEFTKLAQRDSKFSYLFENYEALCKVLTRKATYSKRLQQAYLNGDKAQLWQLVDELQEITEDLKVFYKTFRKLWFAENKGFGFEVVDVRIGGLIARAETVTEELQDYLEGKTDKIYELEEERIAMDFGEILEGDNRYAPVQGHWRFLYTTNHV